MSGRRIARVLLPLLPLTLVASLGVSVAGGPVTISSTQVLRVDADGSHLQQIVQADLALGFSGIDVDPVHGKIYWTSFGEPQPPPVAYSGLIRRANLDGSGIEEVVVGEAGVRVDPAGKVYWWNGSDCDPCSSVWRSNLDGSNVQQLAAEISFTTIDIDPTGGKIYWYDEGTIVVADLDGSDPHVLLDVGSSVAALAVDSEHQMLYWASAIPVPGMDTLNRVGLDGTGNEMIVAGLNDTRGVTLDPAGDRLWWTDGTDGTIRRAHLDGSDVTVIRDGLDSPRQIAFLAGEGQGGGRLYFLSDPVIVEFPVPATSTWGVVALLVTLGLASAAVLRRSRV